MPSANDQLLMQANEGTAKIYQGGRARLRLCPRQSLEVSSLLIS